MITLRSVRLRQSSVSEASVQRFGPWPWYLSAADFVGLDVDIVDDIAGDLVEECAGLSGAAAVSRRIWCVGQILRALPHLAINTLRRGHLRARLRLLGAIATLVLVAASFVVAPLVRVGPPARISTDRGFDANDIVINNVGTVQMPVRALDAHGHTVKQADIRYERMSGDPIELSSTGAISCQARGDAVVRASLGDLAAGVTVHCRPVTALRTPAWHDFLPGDPPQVLRVEAVGDDGKSVTQLRGSARIGNRSVATLRRGVIVPRGVGSSRLTITVGDSHLAVAVVVHEIVKRFDELAPTQRNVAMPLRLAPGDTLTIPLPAGTAWVKWLAHGGATTHPDIIAEGPGYCHVGSEAFIRWLPPGEYGAYCYFGEGARIRVVWSGAPAASPITGALLLERLAR